MGLAGFMLAEEMAKRKRYELPAEFDNDEICTKQGLDGKKKYAIGDKRKTARFPGSPEKEKAEALQVEKFNPYKATKVELLAFLAENDGEPVGRPNKSDLVVAASEVLSRFAAIDEEVAAVEDEQ